MAETGAFERATKAAEAAKEWQDANDALGECHPDDPEIPAMMHRRRIAVHELRDALYVWRVNL